MIGEKVLHFQDKNVDPDSLVSKIEEYLKSDGFTTQHSPDSEHGVVIQAKKGKWFAAIVDADRALTITVSGSRTTAWSASASGNGCSTSPLPPWRRFSCPTSSLSSTWPKVHGTSRSRTGSSSRFSPSSLEAQRRRGGSVPRRWRRSRRAVQPAASGLEEPRGEKPRVPGPAPREVPAVVHGEGRPVVGGTHAPQQNPRPPDRERWLFPESATDSGAIAPASCCSVSIDRARLCPCHVEAGGFVVRKRLTSNVATTETCTRVTHIEERVPRTASPLVVRHSL